MSAATKKKPSKAPAVEPESIPLSALERLTKLRQEHTELELKAKAKEAEIKAAEAEVQKFQQSGMVAPHGWFVGWEAIPVQARPAWKDIALEKAIALGEDPAAVESDAQSRARAAGKTRPEFVVRRFVSEVKS